MLILKLGGAAITDKTSPNTARPTAIAAIANLLAKQPQPLVLVHGAGSFGHILAQEAALYLGYQGDYQRAALVQLQIQLQELNRLVVASLVQAGLPALTVHPASMCIMERGRLSGFFAEPILHMLKLGLLPVLYGDCVWDTAQGFGILSGDQLVVHLANLLGADRVAFGTNVDGVLDESGSPLAQFDLAAPASDQTQNPAQADVTGGMMGKLAEIGDLERRDMDVWVFNLNDHAQLARVLSGEGAGTRIIL